VRSPKEVVSSYFCVEEDATRKLAVVIPNAEGRIYRYLPWSIERDLGSADFRRGHTGSRVDGENSPERSLKRLGGVCP